MDRSWQGSTARLGRQASRRALSTIRSAFRRRPEPAPLHPRGRGDAGRSRGARRSPARALPQGRSGVRGAGGGRARPGRRRV